MASFMAIEMSSRLRGMLHSEMQRKKWLADFHFYVAMRKVIRFYNQNAEKVNTTFDIVLELGNEHDLDNTAAEFIDIHRDHPCPQLWKEALRKKYLQQLTRMNGIVWEEVDEEVE